MEQIITVRLTRIVRVKAVAVRRDKDFCLNDYWEANGPKRVHIGDVIEVDFDSEADELPTDIELEDDIGDGLYLSIKEEFR